MRSDSSHGNLLDREELRPSAECATTNEGGSIIES